MKEEKYVTEAVIVKVEKTGFILELVDTGGEVFGHTSGNMKRFKISLTVGDTVLCEISAYDMTKARITKRL